jgi:hypothetical protein
MSRAAPIHICFYSNRCEWSKAFLEAISKTNYHQDFRFICVDPGPNRPQLPDWLKQTPTLVIRGEKEPRINGDVHNWLYEQRLKEGVGNKTSGNESMEPEPYLDMEMGNNYGDSYSFINADTTAQGNGGLTMAHNFTFLGGQDSVGTREASNFQVTSSNQKRSKKEEMLDLQMEQYMKSRDFGMPQRINRQ